MESVEEQEVKSVSAFGKSVLFDEKVWVVISWLKEKKEKMKQTKGGFLLQKTTRIRIKTVPSLTVSSAITERRPIP